MIGETLAHYRITQKIGAGGMGEVYRATDSKLHRDVAIKVISASYATDPERMARFEREAHVLASLSHGSIAAVYGLEDVNGSKALVMELVEGIDLSDRLKQGPLPLTDALRTASQIAEALEVAHEHGIIHRDLKPANIKLLPDGRIKLLDFGLAKALEAASAEALADSATLSGGATRAGMVMGTAAYMSPEQATGAGVDKRTDVWAFGVVLFEMLTGQRLFAGETTSHTLAEVIRAEIDFARLPATTPSELRGLLERCLDREPRRRLRDIREARLVIDRLLERSGSQHSGVHATVAALPPPVPSRGLGVGQIGAGVAAGVLVAAGAAWVMWPTPSAILATARPGTSHRRSTQQRPWARLRSVARRVTHRVCHRRRRSARVPGASTGSAGQHGPRAARQQRRALSPLLLPRRRMGRVCHRHGDAEGAGVRGHAPDHLQGQPQPRCLMGPRWQHRAGSQTRPAASCEWRRPAASPRH